MSRDAAPARRHRRRPRHWWPATIAGRVAVILLLAFFAAMTIGGGAFLKQRADTTARVFVDITARRIAAIVELMEETPRAQRRRLLRAVNSPTLRVAIRRHPPRAGEGGRPHGEAERMVRRHLRILGPRSVDIMVLETWGPRPDRPPPQGRPGPPPEPDILPSRRKLRISVPQTDGTYLVFTVASDLASWRWGVRMAFWIGLGGLIITLLSIWAAHRLTRPLRQFADAADRLGVDVHSPELPETGSRELREAARAFNRMQERLRRLIDDRTLMLAAISHDLRTVLTRLKLRAEFIDDDDQQHKATRDLDEMQAMLDETLTFAREDAAQEPRTRLDLAALLQGICDDLADAGQDVRYDGPEHLTYAGRPLTLRRAFANLIGNAVKYGKLAEVGLGQTEERITVEIADRGPGIAPELWEKVFTPFYRVEGSRSRETGGTGLGLAVARTAIRRHGGDITLTARDGGGLVARVTLPRDGEL